MTSIAYLDTSAALKLVVLEPESRALADELDADRSRVVAASWLLHTELHCAAGRHPDDVSRAAVNAVLGRVTLVDITRGDLMSAGALSSLRSHVAIHLAVALRIGADAMVSYDRELLDAASAAGMAAVSPR